MEAPTQILVDQWDPNDVLRLATAHLPAVEGRLVLTADLIKWGIAIVSAKAEIPDLLRGIHFGVEAGHPLHSDEIERFMALMRRSGEFVPLERANQVMLSEMTLAAMKTNIPGSLESRMEDLMRISGHMQSLRIT